MNFERKKCITVSVACIFTFFSGVEYVVILPTMWEYMQYLGAKGEYKLALAFAGYSLAGAVSAFGLGRVNNGSCNVKFLILVCSLFYIGGSILYWLGTVSWCIVASRCISGFGSGVSTVMCGDISKAVNDSERKQLMRTFKVCHWLGLLVGPTFNFFLRTFNFTIISISVNKLNASGLFMAIVFVFLEVVIFFMYRDLGREFQQCIIRDQFVNAYNEAVRSKSYGSFTLSSPGLDPNFYKHEFFEGGSGDGSENESEGSVYSDNPPCVELDATSEDCHNGIDMAQGTSSNSCYIEEGGTMETMLLDSDKVMEIADAYVNARQKMRGNEKQPLLTELTPSISQQYPCRRTNSLTYEMDKHITHTANMRNSISLSLHYARNSTSAALLLLLFNASFVRSCLETALTPMMGSYFGYGDFENTVLFIIVEVLSFLVCLLCQLSTRGVDQKKLIIIGTFLMAASLIWCIVYFPSFTPGDASFLPYFGVGVFLIVVTCSAVAELALALCWELHSLNFKDKRASRQQLFASLGLIFGPVFVAITFRREYCLFGGELILTVFAFLYFLWSYNSIGQTPSARRISLMEPR